MGSCPLPPGWPGDRRRARHSRARAAQGWQRAQGPWSVNQGRPGTTLGSGGPGAWRAAEGTRRSWGGGGPAAQLQPHRWGPQAPGRGPAYPRPSPPARPSSAASRPLAATAGSPAPAAVLPAGNEHLHWGVGGGGLVRTGWGGWRETGQVGRILGQLLPLRDREEERDHFHRRHLYQGLRGLGTAETPPKDLPCHPHLLAELISPLHVPQGRSSFPPRVSLPVSSAGIR